MYCTVVAASRSPGIGNGLTYSCNDDVHLGDLVLVKLRGAVQQAVVIELKDAIDKTSYEIQPIVSVLSSAPLLTEWQLKAAREVATQCCCSIRSALSLFLSGTNWKLLLRAPSILWKRTSAPLPSKLGTKQSTVLECVAGTSVEEKKLMEEAGATKKVLSTLRDAGLLESIEDNSVADSIIETHAPTLSDEQQRIQQEIQSASKPSLLFGAAGSGKTEIYLSLICSVLAKGGSAILLFPEIFLTEHLVERIRGIVPTGYSILHSRLTEAARRAEWKKIAAGEYRLVIGSRSALFAPAKNVQLIVLDEEHEWSYKNEQTPRYHARLAAEILARHAKAKLVLGSATPSLESWWEAKEGRYALHRLKDRYHKTPLPKVTVIDLAQVQFGKHYPFSPTLLEQIQKRLKAKEQCILALNRRGDATALLCLDCRRRVISPESGLPFTVHRESGNRPILFDHFSGLKVPVPAHCPHCKSLRLHMVGAGTQRIERQLQELFPGVRLLRADRDSLSSASDMQDLLRKMHEGDADILLGTQSVAKGLDLPRVTLAAVLVADVGLSLPSFRSGERVFQFLSQLTGRSGRKVPGEVIIQTFRPDASEIKAAANHHVEEFLEGELKIRRASGYPPVTHLVKILLRSSDAAKEAKTLQGEASKLSLAQGLQCAVSISPVHGFATKVWQVLLRGNDAHTILKKLTLPAQSVLDTSPQETA